MTLELTSYEKAVILEFERIGGGDHMRVVPYAEASGDVDVVAPDGTVKVSMRFFNRESLTTRMEALLHQRRIIYAQMQSKPTALDARAIATPQKVSYLRMIGPGGSDEA